MLAWTARAGGGETLHIATRDGAAQPWQAGQLGPDTHEVRDPQAVVAPDGLAVVAWAEVTRGGRQSVAIATAAGGGVPGAVRRFVVGDGFAAFPRLVVLRSGAILLAFRDARAHAPARLRVALRATASDSFEAPRTVGSDASSLVVAAAGEGAVMAWATPPRGGSANRTLYALRLDAHGHARGGPVVISRTALATVRLAGSPDGRSIVSWLKPGRSPQGRPPLFTRMFEPTLKPVRLLAPPSGRVVGRPAAVALGASGQTLAAATAIGGEPTAVGVFAARSAFGGAWRGAQRLAAPPAPSNGDPRALLLVSGEGLVIWSQARVQPVPLRYDILLARRAPGKATFAAPEPLSGAPPSPGQGGLLVTTGGERVLVAWPAAAGGLLAVERE